MSEHTRELRLSEAQREREELDELLDQALRQTFPASDPISLQFDRKSRRSVAAAGGKLSACFATRAAAGYRQREGAT